MLDHVKAAAILALLLFAFSIPLWVPRDVVMATLPFVMAGMAVAFLIAVHLIIVAILRTYRK